MAAPADWKSCCDLGCGTGLTGYILAASNPEVQFTGIDIDRDALELARRRADVGGLHNCRYQCPEDGEISRERFSAIFAHGIYSWVDAGTRETLRRFFAGGLEAGGLLFLSYNLLPGWDCLSFIRRRFAASLEESPDQPEQAARRALRSLVELRDAGALAFHDNRAAIGFLNYLVEMDDIRYTLQEFYGADQRAFSFAEIHDGMQALGLYYAGDAWLAENRLELCIAETGLGLLRRCASVRELQSAKDLLQNRLFRRDLYIAGDPARHAGNSTHDALDSVRFGIYGLAPRLPRALRAASGRRIDLDGDFVERLESGYRHRSFSIAELLADEAIDARRDELVDTLLLLIAEQAVGPFAREFRPLPGGAPERIRIPRCNRPLLENPEESHRKIYLASPVVGSGIPVAPLDALLLRAFEHADPQAWLAIEAPAIADKTPHYENLARDFLSSGSEIRGQLDDFRDRLGAYLSLGVVNPAIPG